MNFGGTLFHPVQVVIEWKGWMCREDVGLNGQRVESWVGRKVSEWRDGSLTGWIDIWLIV